MSMIGNLRRLPAADLAQLLAEPELIEQHLDEDPLEGFGQPVDMDVDKAWHGIHFLLTGSSWEGKPPLNFFVSGGTEIGEVDLGYGPARGFSVAEVTRLAQALESLPAETLSERFDPEAMLAQEIYPAIWDADPEDDDTLGYLLEHYEGLREFITEAAEKRQAVIVYLN